MGTYSLKNALVLFGVAILGGIVSLGGYTMLADSQSSSQAASATQASATASKGSQTGNAKTSSENKDAQFTNYDVKKVRMPSFSFKEVSKKVLPTVVHIKTSVKVEGGQGRFPFFDGFPEMRKGSGSGVIYNKEGYIVTNNHVVEKASKVKVTLHDKRTYKAEIVGTDESTDLAVIKIDADNLKPLTIGNSEKLSIGEWVLAVGNPFNLTSTVTAGIVSAKARNLNLLGGGTHIESFIQTDAAVNPGNSGGALVSAEGDLVGINTAIASKTGEYAGYAFAIPASIVTKVADDIIKYGEVKRGFLGVSIRNVNDKIAQKKGLSEIKGALIAGFAESSAAAEAGIQKGDVITSVEGQPIKSVPELQAIIGQKHPGDKVEVTIFRDGETMKKTITLTNRNGKAKIVESSPSSSISRDIGAKLSPLDDNLKEKLGLNYGIKVSEINGGKFAEVGIPEDFIILQINNRKVKTKEDVYQIMDQIKQKDGGILIKGINPDGSKGYYGFGLE
jgi:Do/DeqQ family serine protease